MQGKAKDASFGWYVVSDLVAMCVSVISIRYSMSCTVICGVFVSVFVNDFGSTLAVVWWKNSG